MASRLFMSVIVVAATALGATAASAAGCTGNVQFADAFGQADPGWPTADNMSIGGGKFQIKSDAGKDFWSIYGASLFGDADIFFGFHRLMQSFRPAPSRHQTSGEFVDDNDFAVFDHIIHIAVIDVMGPERLVNVMDPFSLNIVV